MRGSSSSTSTLQFRADKLVALIRGLLGVEASSLGVSVEQDAGAPDRADTAGGGDVGGGVAVDQQQVRAAPGGDAAAIGERKARRWRGRGRGQGLRGGQASLDKEFQLAVQAD